jgi:hypothetical protein
MRHFGSQEHSSEVVKVLILSIHNVKNCQNFSVIFVIFHHLSILFSRGVKYFIFWHIGKYFSKTIFASDKNQPDDLRCYFQSQTKFISLKLEHEHGDLISEFQVCVLKTLLFDCVLETLCVQN